MISVVLDTFVASTSACLRKCSEPADCTLALAPLMLNLLSRADEFMLPRHYRSEASGYTRNLILDASADGFSLYSLVWLPGQWTPVHDHGTWGVVGVVEGVLEERSYVRGSSDRGADSDIELLRGGVILLSRGSVTSFVPNPDHIHITGVPEERPRAVSLHIYGRMMSDFNTYDVAAGTRTRVQVAHNES